MRQSQGAHLVVLEHENCWTQEKALRFPDESQHSFVNASVVSDVFFFQFYFPSFVGRFHENFNHDLSHLRLILIDLIFKIKIQISFLNFLKIIEN